MDTAEWPKPKPKEMMMMMKPMEDIINTSTCSSSPTSCSNMISNNNDDDDNDNSNNHKAPSTALERKVRPQKDEAVNCPRCNSSNTKFCYYNNYSLTQPRYFCKTCKRYWTAGGSLRNIPVGGGSRKNKRHSSSSSSESSASKRISSHDLVAASQSQHMHTNMNMNMNTNMNMNMHMISNPNSNNNNNKFLSQQGQDLNLGFPPTQHHQQFTSLSEFIQLPSITMESTPISKDQHPNPTATATATATSTTNTTTSSVDHHRQQLSALELLHGLTSTRGLTPFIPMSMSMSMSMSTSVPDPNNNDVYSSGYPSLQDFKPSLNFSLDGHGNGNLHGDVQNSGHGGRLLFPFEDLKRVSSNADHGNHNNDNDNDNNDDDEQDRDENGDSGNGYWSGMLGNAGSW